jgi:uncharacterized protein YbbC (DUF1343 family)
MRHGLTLGELSLLLRRELALEVELEVIPMVGWKRDHSFGDTGLPWVPPSPNIPIPETCWVYPGQVLLEGTNLSEGRGTTRPFELFGAPFIEPWVLRDRLNGRGLPGVHFRAHYFEPTSNKWEGQRCGGLQIHVHEPRLYRPYLTTLWVLHEVMGLWGDQLKWRDPPYEFEVSRLPMDLLTGDPHVRRGIEAGSSPDQLEAEWMPSLEEWKKRRSDYLVYPP